jgi:hypothetical protein
MTAKEEIIQILNNAVKEIQQNIVASGQNVTGKTKDSFKTFDNGNIIGIEANKFFGVLETGRGPGKMPYNSKQIIREWMDAKGIFQDKTESAKNSIAYFITRKIQNNGTQLYVDKGRKDIYSDVITDSLINTITDKAGNALLKEIYDGINSSAAAATSIKF